MTHERIAALRIVCNACGDTVCFAGEYDIEGEMDAWCVPCFHEHVLNEPVERQPEGGAE